MSFKEGKQKVELMMSLNESKNKLREIQSDISELQDVIMAYELKEKKITLLTEFAILSPAAIVSRYNKVSHNLYEAMEKLCADKHNSDKSPEDRLSGKIYAIDFDMGDNLFINKDYKLVFNDFMHAGMKERSFGGLKELAPDYLLFKDKKITTEKEDQIVQTVKKDLIRVIKPLTIATANMLSATLNDKEMPKTSVKDLFKKQQYFDPSIGASTWSH